MGSVSLNWCSLCHISSLKRWDSNPRSFVFPSFSEGARVAGASQRPIQKTYHDGILVYCLKRVCPPLSDGIYIYFLTSGEGTLFYRKQRQNAEAARRRRHHFPNHKRAIECDTVHVIYPIRSLPAHSPRRFMRDVCTDNNAYRCSCGSFSAECCRRAISVLPTVRGVCRWGCALLAIQKYVCGPTIYDTNVAIYNMLLEPGKLGAGSNRD